MTLLQRAMLRAASVLVPSPERAEWFAEWSAELCYVTGSATRFCLGAFRDALWLRRNSGAPNAFRAFGLSSPVRCILLLATLAAISVFVVLRRPLALEIILPSPYRDARNLTMISAARRFEAQTPTVPIERYRALAAGAADRFSGIAFYRPFPLRLRTAPLASAEISIAVATENLFRLLEIPIAIPAQPSLVLSDAAWRKYFDADPEIVGRTLEVAGQQAVVAAVIPANSWRLPGRAEAWLLQDQAHLDQLPPATAGFVLGRLPDSKTPPGPEWTLVVPHAGQAADRFHVSSLDKRPLLLSYLFMMAVALLVLAATARLALGDYPVNPPLPGIRLRRWVFLAVKIALLLPIVFCCASLVALDLQAQGLLAASVLGLRWAVIDQRRRCPVCLRLLTNPTRIGGPSQTFLEWYGTELICSQGHGLLYVPEIASSCYSIQRWQYLDPSWTSLFS